MTPQDEGPQDAQGIQQQFAQLQEEMRRVMAAPALPSEVPEDEAAQFRRIELGLEDLRRDADRLRSRMTQHTDESAMTEALAALRLHVDQVASQSEETSRRAEAAAAALSRALKAQQIAIDELGVKLDALAVRRPSRWPLAMGILVGALAIAGALVLTAPDRMQTLIDRINGLMDRAKQHAELTAPAPPVSSGAPVSSVTPLTSAPPVAPASPVAPEPPTTPEEPAHAAAVGPAAPPAVSPDGNAAANLPAAEPQRPSEVAAQAAPSEPAPALVIQPPTSAPPPPVEAAAKPPAPAMAPTGQIVLQAKADTWVEVRDRQGAALIARTLHAGESWSVPHRDGLILNTGNAGGLEILVDGNPAPSLGAKGGVRRNIPLEANLLRGGKYAADAGPGAAAVTR